MPHGRHVRAAPHHWGAAAVAVLAVVLVIAGIQLLKGSPSADTPVTLPSPKATVEATASVDASTRRLNDCRAVWRAQTDTLQAAAKSLAQWRVHVDAMNQLVGGEITLAQASKFWNSTRKGSAARVADFETADGGYADLAPGCLGTSGDSAGRAAPRSLSECAAGVRARDKVIDAAAASITTWKHHIDDMEMLRVGQMTAEQASDMWLKSWRAGVRQLDHYNSLHRRAADAGSC